MVARSAHNGQAKQLLAVHRCVTLPSFLLNPDIDDDLRLMREMGRVLGQSSAIAYGLLEQAGQLHSRLEEK